MPSGVETLRIRTLCGSNGHSAAACGPSIAEGVKAGQRLGSQQASGPLRKASCDGTPAGWGGTSVAHRWAPSSFHKRDYSQGHSARV
jgi:hypothetical protein